jgi:hypothetical protein
VASSRGSGCAAVTSYLAAHLASARLIGRQALTGQALVHGYTTAFWWTAGIFAGGAVICGAPGPQRSAGSAGHAAPSTRRGASAGAGRPRRAGITRRVPDGTWRNPDTA